MGTSPAIWLVFVVVLGGMLLWAGRWRSGRVLVSLAALGWVSIAIFPIDQWALRPLEERFAQPALPQHLDGIIVLGGAVSSAMWRDRGLPALNAAAERMTEFVALARRYPDARLVFTGGPMPARPNGPREAAVARALFAELGLDTEHITFEDRATTTWENAVFSKALVGPKPGETWLLITSANHMPRAIGAFRAVGWEMIAMPVGYKTFHDLRLRHSNDYAEKLELLDIAAHEWIGMVKYWLAGQSSAPFPAPQLSPASLSPSQ